MAYLKEKKTIGRLTEEGTNIQYTGHTDTQARKKEAHKKRSQRDRQTNRKLENRRMPGVRIKVH